MTTISERDVVFTPFMLRVRDAVNGRPVTTDVRLEPTDDRLVVAIDEWFMLRARAEHVIAEANSMLEQSAPRIQLDDEYGTGTLAFVIRWAGRELRLAVDDFDTSRHRARLLFEQSGVATPARPADAAVLEELLIDLLASAGPRTEQS